LEIKSLKQELATARTNMAAVEKGTDLKMAKAKEILSKNMSQTTKTLAEMKNVNDLNMAEVKKLREELRQLRNSNEELRKEVARLLDGGYLDTGEMLKS
jgi:cell division protein FtsB